jgi:serine/threonine protein kinase
VASKNRIESDLHLDYTKQSVFELGVLGIELLLGDHPLPNYPTAYISHQTGCITYADDSIQLPISGPYPISLLHLLRQSLACEPHRRPTLSQFLNSLSDCLRQTF